MIIVHTLKGQEIAINGALIERIEQDHETHVTLANGTSYTIRESLEDVIDLQREDRATVKALGEWMQENEEPPGVVHLFSAERRRSGGSSR